MVLEKKKNHLLDAPQAKRRMRDIEYRREIALEATDSSSSSASDSDAAPSSSACKVRCKTQSKHHVASPDWLVSDADVSK